ncbi:MAG: HAD hydrolase-like protein, partial [Oscillospiraceae bacterium]|nr:HAD hydrolase-like protein [Oscillospiraceae bacterium]
MSFDILLFDLDGTLTDPKEGITKCVQYALAHFGIAEPDLDRLIPFIGPPLDYSFMEFYGFNAKQAKEAIEVYRSRFSTVGLFENNAYAGIKQLLARQKQQGKIL